MSDFNALLLFGVTCAMVFLAGLWLQQRRMRRVSLELDAEREPFDERWNEATPDPTLLATGDPAEATVVEVEETRARFNDVPILRLLLDVHRPAGAVYRPDSKSNRVETMLRVPRLKFSQVQTGSILAVRIDPNDPSKVAIVLR